jgi:hypothetical protein
MKKPTRHTHLVWFASIVAGVLLAATSLTLVLSYAQLGTYTPASFSLCQGVDARLASARQILDPKLVLIGGSGVRRGVNAAMVAEALQVPVLNFGMQAGLGPAIILYEAKKILRPGDTALLLFEFNSFTYDQPTTIAIDYLYGCRPDYFSGLGLAEEMTILFNIDPLRVLKSVTFKPPKNRCPNCTGDEDAAPAHGPIGVGDLPLEDEPLSRDRAARMALYQPISVSVNRQGAGPRAIAEFMMWARANHVTVIASWPNTIDFPAYEGSAGFKEIADFYASLEAPMIGEPEIALMPLRYFYDTQYHLNAEGIAIRSRRLAEALREHMASLPRTDRAANTRVP